MGPVGAVPTRAYSSNWLERLPCKQQVHGSNPCGSTSRQLQLLTYRSGTVSGSHGAA